MLQLSFSSVSFTYESLTTPLIENLSFSVAAGWTGIVGPNGSGKSTLLALSQGSLRPSQGSVAAPKSCVYCPQRTDDRPTGLNDLLGFPDADAGRLASLFALEADWPYRWESLSHGERKRAQIATALWEEPELLLIDEPTNHLDMEAREILIRGLGSFAGVGLIVSHDRELLDALCAQCLFLDLTRPAGRRAVLRPGGVSAGLAQQEREDQQARRAIAAQESELRRLRSEAERRSQEAGRQESKKSRRNLARKDSDGRAKIGLAVLTGKDGVAGRLAAGQVSRLERAQAQLESMERPIGRKTGVHVDPVDYRGDRLLWRPRGELVLGDRRRLAHGDLLLRPGERRALIGANGSGKSTLVRALLPESQAIDPPGSGTLPGSAGRYLYLPQELSVRDSAAIYQKLLALDPQARGRVLSTLQRLGSEPVQVLESRHLSPGEARKLALALALEDAVSLIVMDEPTNHLDIVSLRCLEEALGAFQGALLLVSHDRPFLRALATRCWALRDGRVEESLI